MSAADRAEAQFSTPSACSQSVAVAFADRLGMEKDLIHRITTGFGGGMGSRQFTCGAVTGGIFVLSAAYGSNTPDEAENKAATKERVDRYMNAVEERLGALGCYDLLGCNLAEAGEKDLFSTQCPHFVRTCAEEVEKIMNEDAS